MSSIPIAAASGQSANTVAIKIDDILHVVREIPYLWNSLPREITSAPTLFLEMPQNLSFFPSFPS